MILDTSGLFAMFDATDKRNAKAVEYYRTARVRLTHSYILAELIALALARRVPQERIVRFAEGLLDNPDVRTIWDDRLLHSRGHALLLRRLDKNYSLCDAVSFELMRDSGIRESLTTDQHFEQEGFIRLL